MEIRGPAYHDIRLKRPVGHGEAAVAGAGLQDDESNSDGDDNPVEGEEKPVSDSKAYIQGDLYERTNPSSHDGNFGIICANYGGDRNKPVDCRIKADICESPGHVFCFQEATEHFCKSLAEPEANEGQPIVRKTTWNKRTLANSSPEPHIFVVRGTERGKTSTAVAVRDSHFRAIRRDQFLLHDAGKEEKGKQAFNMLMFCTAKFR